MSDLFALQLMQSISTVVDGNTSVLDSADSVDAADRCSLRMFDSQFVKRLVTWLRLTMEAHVNAGKESASNQMAERLAHAEKDNKGLRDELLSSRATVQKLQKDLQDVRTEEARVAVAAVQALTDDMSTQRAAYEGKVREQYAEILRLKAEAARARDSADVDIEEERKRLSDELLDASRTVTELREELQQKEEELSKAKKDLETQLQQKNGPHVILRLLPPNGGCVEVFVDVRTARSSDIAVRVVLKIIADGVTYIKTLSGRDCNSRKDTDRIF
ncbi:hypothetical protein C8Q74DRAFT_1021511 [Fomes fomentarius]|nr:hypothetical protein C8Q74DRAFT_1021511 [Fomes fomentarius]